ncbi:hypothetical protein [Selenihalanaerobacter shriftii]|uniref:4 TMS phage holin, superfamily IV n=1 Tax=Selenihalanaerobacter shriftii TaxID=142842 RepID=A0A1T4LGG7_9FIRM|nr:hypothetical protein [Selenihalanaerobacter shriftii]SJZ53687.1 hypothetical protein SAMN02745118_01123 [Selenihalanaerobacter shriftii]
MRTLTIRFGLVTVILLLTGVISTTFNQAAFFNLILVSLMISIVGYLIKFPLDEKYTPLTRGIVNFIGATIIIYLFTGLIYSALFSAFAIGLLETLILTRI